MKLDTVSMSVVGATIVLALSAGSASAQAKPKSQKRIPISKESNSTPYSLLPAATPLPFLRQNCPNMF